jgi:hypothetical protein
MFKGLKIWFSTKHSLFQLIEKMNRIAEIKISYLTQKLEVLEQGKIYLCYVEGASEQLERVKETYTQATMRLKWTAPTILFSNNSIKELSQEEIDQIISQNKNKVTK